MVRQIPLFALAAGSIFFAQCKAKEDAFFGRYFTCDSRSAENSCGTTRAGAPMTCFAGTAYGASDFCAEPCDANRSDPRFTCRDGASLQVCDAQSHASTCPQGLRCSGTGSGQGLCVLPCADASRCGNARIALEAGPETLPEAGVPLDADASIAPDALVLCSGAIDPCRAAGSDKPRVCVSTTAFGGDDFCAETCDPAVPPADPDQYRCIDTGALLMRCHPNGKDAAAGCPSGLHCFRTDLLGNEGLCLNMPVCSENKDCMGSSHTTCAATLLGGAAASMASGALLDHLNCVTTKCGGLQSMCGTTEGCLGAQYASALADICVPRCDANQRCPPDFSCGLAVSGPGASDLCFPGVPGGRCNGNSDHCVVGSCEDAGAGFSVCTLPCPSDAFCQNLNTSGDPFVCVNGGGPHPHCVTPRPFHGANCFDNSQCNVERGELCFQFDPMQFTTGHGECRLPCKNDGTCEPQGGLPFTCLFDGAGGCYPGVLGLACILPSECISGLSCQDVLPELDDDPDAMAGSRICTVSCAIDGGTDSDGDALCDDPHTIAQGGYCGRGTCRFPRPSGRHCDRPEQCRPALCDPTTNTCVARTTSAP
jgi:hypothetical protein